MPAVDSMRTAPPDAKVIVKPAPAKTAAPNSTLPSRARVMAKDTIIGRDSVIQLPRRTLPLAKPKTP